MMKKITFFLLSLVFSLPQLLATGTEGPAAFPQITNVYARNCVSLDGTWRAIADIFDTGFTGYHGSVFKIDSQYFADQSFYDDKTRLVEYDFDSAMQLKVPGDWNTQNDKLYYYEGSMWYRTKFDFTQPEGCRTFLYFGAANYEAIAAVNKTFLGSHTGGFTPFNFEVTDLLKEKDNSLVVRVNNVRNVDNVPTINFDWWNYGGLTRDVMLVTVPQTFIRDYSIALDKDVAGKINGWVQLDGKEASQKVTIEIPELKLSLSVQTDEKGFAAFEAKAKPVLWCPENPKLYELSISSRSDKIVDKVGFRTVKVDGGKILLNGKQIFLKGVAIHEEAPFTNGRVVNPEQAKTLLNWAKEMGCNFVRLAHYPHNEAMIRLAEQMGILVWDEIPVYWAINWNNQSTYDNAQSQLVDMITRDKNRANVIIWSVANETPRKPERLVFLSKLIAKAKELDPTRLVSAAMEKKALDPTTLTVDDELIQYADIISFNQYVGWYDGSSDKCDKVDWVFPVDKPVVVTEFGGGALAGNHGPVTERFTEEYQEYLFQKNLEMFSRMKNFSGLCPWVLKDFRSPKRMLTGIQDDFNRKGLVSDRGEKKKAFYVMQKYYESR